MWLESIWPNVPVTLDRHPIPRMFSLFTGFAFMSRDFYEIVHWTFTVSPHLSGLTTNNSQVITSLRSCDMVWYANVRLGGQHCLTLHNQLKETRLQIKLELWFKNIKTNALWNFFENKTTSISNLNTWNRILMYWKLWIHNLNGLNLTLFANIKFPPIPNCNFFNLI